MSITTDNPPSHLGKTGPMRVQRYRKRNRRLDYYPSPDVADIVNHYRATGSDQCLAGIIDELIRAGHRAITSNARKPK